MFDNTRHYVSYESFVADSSSARRSLALPTCVSRAPLAGISNGFYVGAAHVVQLPFQIFDFGGV